jgi:hypothetical protein
MKLLFENWRKFLITESEWGEGIHFSDKAKQLERTPDGTEISRVEIAKLLNVDLDKIKKKGFTNPLYNDFGEYIGPGPDSEEVDMIYGWALYHAIQKRVRELGYRAEDIFELVAKLQSEKTEPESQSDEDLALSLLKRLSIEKTFHGLTPEISIQIFIDGIRNGTYPNPRSVEDIETGWNFVYSIFDPSDTSHLEESLYYGTSTIFQEEIAENGIKAPSEWGDYGLAEENAFKIVEEHGGKPVIIQIPLSEFKKEYFLLDESSDVTIIYTEDLPIFMEKQQQKLL